MSTSPDASSSSSPPSTLESLKQSSADAASTLTSTIKSAASSIADTATSLVSSNSPPSDFVYSDLYAVTVRLHGASELSHPCDAFVTVSLDKEQERRSKAIKNTADPKWEETFSFVVKEKPQHLHLSLFDHRMLGKNHLKGEVDIDLTPLVQSSEATAAPKPPGEASISAQPATPHSPAISPPPVPSPRSPSPPSPTSSPTSPQAPVPPPVLEQRLPIQPAKGENGKGGFLHVTVIATAINQVMGRSSHTELNDVREADIDALTSLLDLTLVSASHLKKVSLFSQDSTFAVVTFGFQSFHTPVVHKTADPKYDQICPIWLKRDTQSFVLKISIYQHEPRYRHQQLIGNAFLRVNELQQAQQYNLNLPLTKEDPHTDKDLAELLSTLSFDVNKGGVESATASVQVHVQVKKREVVEGELYDLLMKTYDTNEDGALEEEEILHLCQTVGAHVSDEDVKKAMHDTAHGNPTEEVNVKKEELHALFRHPAFKAVDFLRTLHAIVLHGPDAMHSLMLKNFMYPGSHSHHKGQLDDSDPTVDNDNTQILVFDREAGIVVKEAIPAYIKAAMRLMYRSRGGRVMSHLTKIRGVLRNLTIEQGKKMDAPASVKMIPVFIHTHNLNVNEVEKPISDYHTFNEFFYRKLKPGVRSPEAEGDDRVLISPADCRMMVFDSVEDAKTLWIKGQQFSIANTLAAADTDGSLTAGLTGGALVIARLAPQDYHRWHWPVAGKPGPRTPIAGDYNTVNPIAIRKNVDVYTENKRVVCPIDTQAFGKVVLVAVGASMVGSINFVDAGEEVHRFDEHGWFAFGGSTVLVFLPPGVVAFDEDLMRNSKKSLETLIKVGRRIGVATGKAPSPSSQGAALESAQGKNTEKIGQ